MLSLSLLCVLICLSLVAAQADVNSPNWRLAWSDEFTAPTLDTTKWNARDIIGNQGNGELQWYSPNQVSISNGKLVITAAKITTQGMSYTSGWVDSQDLGGFTYGRFVVNAKMAGGKGMWPAIWMLSETVCWPWGIEYDIVEYRGLYPNQYASNYHYSSKQECCAIGVSSSCVTYYGTTTKNLPDLSAGFHTYTMDVWPTNFTFYFDGTPIFSKSTGGSGQPPVSPTPHYWVINSAVGGGYPTNPNASTVFPNTLEVDYIRVYEYRASCAGNPCSGHGCCNATTSICTCNPGWTGTNCEVWNGQSTHNFSALTSLETCINGWQNDYSTYITSRCSVAKNLLTLTINTTNCPSQCGNKPYGTGAWQSQSMYGYGSFSFIAKGGGVSGTALTLQAAGKFGGMQQQIYFSLVGANKNQVQLWTFANNYQFQYPSIQLSFDWSAAYHNYTFVFSSTKIDWYIDGVLKLSDTRNIPFGKLSPGAFFTVEPDWYGAFTYPGSMNAYLTSASWSTSGGPAATC